jgi:hypothetical protein
MYAAEFGHFTVAQALLSGGANPALRNQVIGNVFCSTIVLASGLLSCDFPNGVGKQHSCGIGLEPRRQGLDQQLYAGMAVHLARVVLLTSYQDPAVARSRSVLVFTLSALAKFAAFR